jgi:hypothetical protein
VEIHKGGAAGTEGNGATFKWSRENGSVVFPIVKVVVGIDSKTITVTIENLGRDSNLSLEVDNWVEIVDDDYILQVATLQGSDTPAPLDGSVNPLLQVEKIETDPVNPTNVRVTLKNKSDRPLSVPVGQYTTKHPLLRRWDQKDGTSNRGDSPTLLNDGTIQIKEDGSWITLEDGVQVQFQRAAQGYSMKYRTGDYWLIPARTIIGDVLWPQDPSGNPEPLPPHGVQHHYALLALISFDGSNPVDLRYKVPPLGKLLAFLDIGSGEGLNIRAFKDAGL